jgi:hypothetical protein
VVRSRAAFNRVSHLLRYLVSRVSDARECFKSAKNEGSCVRTKMNRREEDIERSRAMAEAELDGRISGEW